MDELGRMQRRNSDFVQQAAKHGVWQAAACILERRFLDRWVRRGPRDGSPVHISADQVTIKQDPK